jgi:hypothetical protein
MSVKKEEKKEFDDDLILTFKEILSVNKEMGKINSDLAEVKLDMIRSD